MGSPERVFVLSASLISAASTWSIAALVTSAGVPLGNSTVDVIMKPSTSGNTSNLRIPPFIKPKVRRSMLMATQNEI